MMMMIRVDLEEAWFPDCGVCVGGYSGPRGLIFWSIKTDLFFIVNSSFWVTIQVGRGEFGFLDCVMCRWTFRTSRVDILVN